MARFSVTDAATSGFGVIRREPLAVLVWGAVILVVLVLPICGLSLGLFSQLAAVSKGFANTPGAPAPTDPAMMDQMMRFESQLIGLDLAAALFAVAMYAVIAGAVFRAVLEPEQKRFFFLRVGGQELWLGLLFLTQGILTYIVFFVGMLVVALLAGLGYLAGSSGGTSSGVTAAILVGVVAGLGAYGTLIWALLRLSMAAPMSFTQRQFRLFESWDFTRGQGWRLLGMFALVMLIILGLELVLYGVIGVGLLAVGGGIAPFIQSLQTRSPDAVIRALAPIFVVGAGLGAFVMAGLLTIVFAPVATAYRDLRASASDGASTAAPVEV